MSKGIVVLPRHICIICVCIITTHPIVMVGYVMRAGLGGGGMVGWENNTDHIDSIAPRWSHFILPIEAGHCCYCPADGGSVAAVWAGEH